jgi:hypothetical protein
MKRLLPTPALLLLLAARAAALDVSITDPPYRAAPGGTVDCRAAVQAAIDAVQAAGGGRVLIPSGLFLVRPRPGNNAALGIIGSNVALVGTGSASVLYNDTLFPDGDGQGVLTVSAKAPLDNIKIEEITFRNAGNAYHVTWAGLALIYVPGPSAGISNLAIRHCRFETPTRTCIAIGCTVKGFEIAHNVLPSMGETGIYLAGVVSDGEVHHNWMGAPPKKVVGAPGISLRNPARVRIHHNHVTGAQNTGIFLRGPNCTDLDVEFNDVFDCTGTSAGIAVEQGTRITVRGNRVTHCAGTGIYLGGFFPIRDVRIIDNDVSGCGLYGICAERRSQRPRNVQIEGNSLSDNKEGLGTDGIDGTCLVRNNTVLFACRGNANPGLRIMDAGGSARTLVKGNVVRGYTAWGSGVSIHRAAVQADNDCRP